MAIYQFRTYTLATAEALRDYAENHWPRHIPSLRSFGVETHGIWVDHDSSRLQLSALISFPEGGDPGAIDRTYMASAEFKADMEGFDVANIVRVDQVLLDPTTASPLG